MPQLFGDVQIWIRRVTSQTAGANELLVLPLYVIRSAYNMETGNPSIPFLAFCSHRVWRSLLPSWELFTAYHGRTIHRPKSVRSTMSPPPSPGDLC